MWSNAASTSDSCADAQGPAEPHASGSLVVENTRTGYRPAPGAMPPKPPVETLVASPTAMPATWVPCSQPETVQGWADAGPVAPRRQSEAKQAPPSPSPSTPGPVRPA